MTGWTATMLKQISLGVVLTLRKKKNPNLCFAIQEVSAMAYHYEHPEFKQTKRTYFELSLS